jgi:hypothetical protein
MRRLSSSWTSWSRRGGALHRSGCEGPGAEPFPVVLGRSLARPPRPRRLFPPGKHRHARASVKVMRVDCGYPERLCMSGPSTVMHESDLSRSRPYPYAGAGASKDLPRRRRRPVGARSSWSASPLSTGQGVGQARRSAPTVSRTGVTAGNGAGNGRARRGTADGDRPGLPVCGGGSPVRSDPGGSTGSPAHPVPDADELRNPATNTPCGSASNLTTSG